MNMGKLQISNIPLNPGCLESVFRTREIRIKLR